MKKDADEKSKNRVVATLTTATGAIAGFFTGSAAVQSSRDKQYERAKGIELKVGVALANRDPAAARSQIEALVAPSVMPVADSLFEAAAKGEPTREQYSQLGRAIRDSQPTWVSRVPGGSKTVYAAATVAGSALAYGTYKAIKSRKNGTEQADEPKGKHTAALEQERAEQAATSEKSASR